MSRMNKPLPIITASPETSQKGLRAEPEAKKRQRLQTLYLLASGQAASRCALAPLLAVHRHTVRAWLTLDEEGGLKALLTIHKAPDKVSALPPPVREKRQARLNQPQGFASYSQIQQDLRRGSQGTLVYEMDNLGRHLIFVSWDKGFSVPVFPQ